MAKIGKKQLLRHRISMLETNMKLRRTGENELNRRIDNLVETVTEMDKKTDILCVTCGALLSEGSVRMHNQWHDRMRGYENWSPSPSVQEFLDSPLSRDNSDKCQ